MKNLFILAITLTACGSPQDALSDVTTGGSSAVTISETGGDSVTLETTGGADSATGGSESLTTGGSSAATTTTCPAGACVTGTGGRGSTGGSPGTGGGKATGGSKALATGGSSSTCRPGDLGCLCGTGSTCYGSGHCITSTTPPRCWAVNYTDPTQVGNAGFACDTTCMIGQTPPCASCNYASLTCSGGICVSK